MTIDFAALAAPFPPDAVHWRAQLVTERDGKFSALALAYLDARDVMDRLDAVCQPQNWQSGYVETARGRVIGTISILVGDNWISKSDGAGDTDVEGEKGGISDSLKRAGVNWGIGRYLYRLGNTWADCTVVMRDGKPVLNKSGKPIFKDWTSRGRVQLAEALRDVAPNAKPCKAQDDLPEPVIDDAQWAELTTLIEASGADAQAMCKHYNVPSLKQLTQPQFGNISGILKKRLSGAQKEGE